MNDLDLLKRKLDRLLSAPDDAGLYNDIGVLLYRLKDWENAENYLCRAYELLPSDPDILFDYAVILCRNRKWRKALPLFQLLLRDDPGCRKIIEKAGDACYHLGKYEKAARIYRAPQDPRKEVPCR